MADEDFLYDLGLENEQIGVLHKLPEGFKKVKYLIANGSQYIDTGYVPTNETGYYLEGQGYKAATGDTFFYGCVNTTTWADNTRIYAMSTPKLNYGWGTFSSLSDNAAYLRQEVKVSQNFLNSRKCVMTSNNTDFSANLPQLSFTPNKPLYLFAVNLANTGISGPLEGRIDTFLISEGDQIVRQFVPCLDADGIPCMYELYTGTAYYNQGSGNFSYPRVYTNDPINLPAGYTKCVYLQSSGTQYIDTLVVPNNETGVYIEAQCLGNADTIPFGSSNGTQHVIPPHFNTSTKASYWAFGCGRQAAFYYDKGDDLIYKSSVNLYNDRSITLNTEDTKWSGLIGNLATKFPTIPLWLFSYNADNKSIPAVGKFVGRIFRAKITQGDTLIHDFVPCLDNSSTPKPCMYDLVTDTPYYNKGTGNFSYCVEHQLPSNFAKLDYIESTGTQIIKTGIVPTNNTGIYVDAYHTKYNGDTDWSVIGLRNTNGNTYFAVGRVQRDTNGAGFGWGAFTTPGGNGNVRYEASLNWLNDKKSIITAPAFAQRTNTLSTLSFTPTKDLYMFGMNNYDGAATVYSTYRIYRAKISEGSSSIVRDFVPAYDEVKNKPCMYDLINNVPYYNDGTGEFIMPAKREGTYKGFALLSGIGNRLGYGEPFRGNESGGGSDNYLLLSCDDDWMNQQFVDTGITISKETVGAIKLIFERKIHESWNPGDITYAAILASENYVAPDEHSGIWTTGYGEVIISYSTDMHLEGKYWDCSFDYNQDEIVNVFVDYNNKIVTCNEITESLIEHNGWFLPDGSTHSFQITSCVSTATKIYECFFYDTEGNEISHMIPHEENGEKGLYCTVRNIFLPIQTL